MRDRVWARLAAVIAAVLALLAVPPEAIAVEPTVSLPAHAYDGQHRPAIVASDAVERGPPARTSTASTSVAADGWSSDASARSERAGTPTAYTYNDFAESVQVVKAPATTSEVTPDIQRTPAPTTRWQAAANSVRSAAPSTLTRAEVLRGRASQRTVNEIAESMRVNGWQGAPIDVVELNGQRVVVDGHHRLAAARRAGIDVQYRVVDPSTVIGPGRYTSIDDILQSTYSVGRDRLR